MQEDQVLLVSKDINLAPFGCLISIGFFYATNSGLNQIIPKEVTSQGPETIWKFKNVANSFIHSFITGLGSLICLYLYPDLAENVIINYAGMALVLSAFTTGYFIFDFLDMYHNYRRASTYELLLHHIMAISCFALSSISRYYLGFAVIGLLIEVNSFFLHWRQLLLLSGTKKSQMNFRIVSLLNLATFIVFRIVTIGWMIKWLSRNRDQVPLGPYIIGCSTLCTVMVMSIVLFFRLLRSDYLKPGHSKTMNKEHKIN